MIVRWSRAAARQLFEAGDYLKRARPGLEDKLYTATREVTRRIADEPRAFAVTHEAHDGEVRRALVETFKYWVIYEVFADRDECVVLAFWSTRRHPDGWRRYL